MGEPKQIILMRTDLGMRKGKMIAQGAHASLKVILDNRESPWPALENWLAGPFVKICVRVENEKDLLGIMEQAQAATLHCALILDEGRTEFGGIPTYTCGAIGPEFSEHLQPITGHLKLL